MKSLRASSLVVAFITLSALFFQASGKKGKNSALPTSDRDLPFFSSSPPPRMERIGPLGGRVTDRGHNADNLLPLFSTAASHFRYGTLSWVPKDSNKVEFTLTAAYRADYDWGCNTRQF